MCRVERMQSTATKCDSVASPDRERTREPTSGTVPEERGVRVRRSIDEPSANSMDSSRHELDLEPGIARSGGATRPNPAANLRTSRGRGRDPTVPAPIDSCSRTRARTADTLSRRARTPRSEVRSSSFPKLTPGARPGLRGASFFERSESDARESRTARPRARARARLAVHASSDCVSVTDEARALVVEQSSSSGRAYEQRSHVQDVSRRRRARAERRTAPSSVQRSAVELRARRPAGPCGPCRRCRPSALRAVHVAAVSPWALSSVGSAGP